MPTATFCQDYLAVVGYAAVLCATLDPVKPKSRFIHPPNAHLIHISPPSPPSSSASLPPPPPADGAGKKIGKSVAADFW